MKPEGSEQRPVYVCKEHGAAANEYGQATCAQTGTHTMVPIPRWMSDHWEALEGRIGDLERALHLGREPGLWLATALLGGFWDDPDQQARGEALLAAFQDALLAALAPAEAVEEEK